MEEVVSNYINKSATKKNLAISAMMKLNSDGFESAWWAILNWPCRKGSSEAGTFKLRPESREESTLGRSGASIS